MQLHLLSLRSQNTVAIIFRFDSVCLNFFLLHPCTECAFTIWTVTQSLRSRTEPMSRLHSLDSVDQFVSLFLVAQKERPIKPILWVLSMSVDSFSSHKIYDKPVFSVTFRKNLVYSLVNRAQLILINSLLIAVGSPSCSCW